MKFLRTVFAFLGFTKEAQGAKQNQTNLIPIDGYLFENKDHLLQDAEHQLHKIDDRYNAILVVTNNRTVQSDLQAVNHGLEEIERLRLLFIKRTEDIAACSADSWESVKKDGKEVNDALLSALARMEQLLGLPVGEG